MIEINLNKVKKNYGFTNVLNDISFEVKTKEKVALIGANGCGKTTILNIIAGMESIDEGTISIRKEASIGVLTQLPKYADELVRDILYKGIENELALKEKLAVYEEKLLEAEEQELNKMINAYTKLQDQFISMGGYELDARIGKIMDIFSIDKDFLDRKMTTLSGGEKTNINLASIILSNPDILLLDEPTNYLDIEKIEWLEEFLNQYKGTMIVVSHDRYFLDRVTTKTILIEREQAEIFYGNYSYFLEENENRIMLEFKDYKNQQKQIEAIKAAIKKLRDWGKIGENEKFFKRANSMEKRLEKMELLDKPLEKREIPIHFDLSDRSGKDVVSIKDLTVAFDNKIILNEATLEVKYGEKVCIIGPNGSGKTTLIKEILSGNNIRVGTNVTIGYISQEIQFDDEKLSVLDEARNHFDGQEQYLRASLCKFLFYDKNVFKKIKYLSGGEKIRLKLFCLMQKNNNLLLFDEPTNHIDIDTKEILETALQKFKGTVLFISHDRYFINKLADKIASIENNKIVTYIGNYDDYKRKNKR